MSAIMRSRSSTCRDYTYSPGLLFLVSLAIGLAAPAAAQDSPLGALLLKDSDRVLRGRIELRGDFYEVEIAPQSRVSVPKSRVAIAAANLEELYRRKCRTIAEWNIGDHFQLTRWCMVNELFEPATEHYLEVARQQPDHPRVKQLGHELREKLLEDPGFREYLGLAPKSEASPASSPEAQPTVTAAADTFEMAQHPAIARRFTERVLPILINRCGQAACHGAQSTNRLQVLEPYPKAYARLASANLNSALAHVEAADDELAPLLRYATTAHGIQRAPAITLTETELLNELRTWIEFTKNPVIPAVAEQDGGESTVMERGLIAPRSRTFVPFQPEITLIPVRPGESGLNQVPTSGAAGNSLEPHMLDMPGDGEAPLPSATEIDALDAQLKQILGDSAGAAPPAVGPADPFDPAEFNRQAHQPR